MSLTAEQISVAYSNTGEIIRDLSFTLNDGELVCLVGPNGSGKSTLLKALARILPHRRGRICIDGQPMQSFASTALARYLAYLPQAPGIPQSIMVRDLVSYGRHPHLSWMRGMRKADWDIVDWAIEITALTTMRERDVNNLSGGERQRVWLAMALSQQPRVLLLDEPTTFLDISYQVDVLELVQRLNRQLGLSIIMVLHDLNQALRYTQRVAVMHAGTIAGDGIPEAVLTPTLMRQVFQVEVKLLDDPYHACKILVPTASLHATAADSAVPAPITLNHE